MIKIREYKKIVGKCKQCGKCCKDLQVDSTIPYPDHNNSNEMIRNNFDAIVNDSMVGHIKDNPYLDFSDINEVKIIKHGIAWTLRIYGVECRALKRIRGKYVCTIHKDKPYICCKFPSSNSILRPGCGYHKRTVKETGMKE